MFQIYWTNEPNKNNIMKKNKSKLGRRGDPRMHKAVAARLKNPNLTLLDALREGGFNYPQEALNMGTFSDADNIQLCQRKNQLSRRLRFARRRTPRMDKENAEGTDDTSDCGSSVSWKERKNSSGITPRKRKEIEDDQVLPSNNKNDHNNNNQSNLQDFYFPTLPVVATKCNNSLPIPPPPIHISCPNRQKVQTTTDNPLPLASKVTPSSNNENGQLSHRNMDHIIHDKLEHRDPPQLIFTNQDCNTSSGESHHNHPNTNITHLTTKNAIHNIKTEDLSIDKNEHFNELCPPDFVMDSKTKNALSYFRAEISSLLKKSMLSAGFEGTQTDECDSSYINFAGTALRIEMTRIERLSSLSSLMKASKDTPETNSKISSDTMNEDHPHNHTTKGDHTSCSSHHHNHTHDHDDISNQKQNTAKTQNCFEGRHVHRLEGKCGHKAIIHKPENGPAHVDFVVNGRVECYQGLKPVGKDVSDIPLWPSKYSCAQLISENKKDSCHTVRVSPNFYTYIFL